MKPSGTFLSCVPSNSFPLHYMILFPVSLMIPSQSSFHGSFPLLTSSTRLTKINLYSVYRFIDLVPREFYPRSFLWFFSIVFPIVSTSSLYYSQFLPVFLCETSSVGGRRTFPSKTSKTRKTVRKT